MNENEYKKLHELALSVLKLSRNTLVIHLRFMDTAISRLSWVSLPELIAEKPEFAVFAGCGLMTEGTALIYDPAVICKLYATAKEHGPRAYLHMVLHCVFRHFLVAPTINIPLWDLACDMAIEGVINGLGLHSLDTARSKKQQQLLDKIAPEVNHLLTAEKIYHYLQDARLPAEKIAELGTLFIYDNHNIWYTEHDDLNDAGKSGADQQKKPSAGKNNNPNQNNSDNGTDQSNSDNGTDQSNSDNGTDQSNSDNSGPSSGDSPAGNGENQQNISYRSRNELEQDWRDIAEHMQLDMETFSKQQGDQAGGMMQNLREVNREKYDYTAFLKKFAVMGEAMKINDDEFDYIFYSYGMKLFPEKRLPLIEPLEYKDVKRIREFVIAIDTSGSVEGEQVQAFLQKTYNILKSTDSFFDRVNLHIIQCDAEIQEHVKITKQDEFDRYLKTMRIKGLGGTDFRPVFSKVNELIRNHEFNNLKGLIYFTDGYGTFPERMPQYKTAFVFVQDGYEIPEVPVWAIKLVLQRDELERLG